MTPQQIKAIYRRLIFPMILGLCVLIAGLALIAEGHHTRSVYGFFGIIFGLVFISFPLVKIIRFRKYLRDNDLR